MSKKKKINIEDIDWDRMAGSVEESIPEKPPGIIPWSERFVELPGSTRSKSFRASVTPWTTEPMLRATDLETRIVTLMKPVQSGGSVFGEVVMLFWIMFWRGFLQYNWSNDKRSEERWASRVFPVLKSCAPVYKRMQDAGYVREQVDFGNVFFRQQGVYVPDNLDSDTISLQINEEIHSWERGHLKKADGRLTAVWNSKQLNISNAGIKGDQLDDKHASGTMQKWEVLCPGCKSRHVMRTKWDKKRPELGGLRYDADGCRIGKFKYNYQKLRPTIRYQMPCGFEVPNEDVSMRRKLNSAGSGAYGSPTNTGAELSNRSYTYDSVIVDYIDWMILIQDKHTALLAQSAGDPEPFRRYRCERECIPYDIDDVPSISIVEVKVGLKKNRKGLGEKRLIRFFALDRQQGQMAKNEFPHWWLVIRDFGIVDDRLTSQLVYEGKIDTDEGVIATLVDHKCNMWQGVADSGDDTTHVYLFCIKNGINAIKGSGEDHFSHEGGARRIFSPERPLHVMLGRASLYPYVETENGMVPDPREPLFWLYSKSGIRERLNFLRTSTAWLTPDDVSEDYNSHMGAEERTEIVTPTGERVFKWIQTKSRNDLFVDEAYIAMQVDQARMIQFV